MSNSESTSTSIRSISTTEHIFAVVEDEAQVPTTDTIEVDSSTAAYYGLPERTFTAQVVGTFEKNEIDSSGYFMSIPSSELSEAELAIAHKRGIFQKPSQFGEKAEIVTIPWETNVEGPGGTLRIFVTSSNVTEAIVDRVKDEVKSGLSQNESDEEWTLQVESYVADRKDWLPIDYSLLLGQEYKTDGQSFKDTKTSLELFLLLDERTAEDATKKREALSVNVVYQLTQMPERKDPIRTARYTAKAIGQSAASIIAGSFKFEAMFEADPDEPVVLVA